MSWNLFFGAVLGFAIGMLFSLRGKIKHFTNRLRELEHVAYAGVKFDEQRGITKFVARPDERNLEGMQIIPIPAILHEHISANNRPVYYSQLLLEMSHGKFEHASDEIRRVISACAMYFGGTVPNRLVLLDARTQGFYLYIQDRLALVHPEAELLSTEGLAEFNKAYVTRLSRYIDEVGKLLIQLTIYKGFSSFAIFEKQVKRYMHTEHADELCAIVTACAILMGVKIPISYVYYGTLTTALVNAYRSTSGTPHLTLVK
jgi:hypothetical protein